jgi:hypothetical protein
MLLGIEMHEKNLSGHVHSMRHPTGPLLALTVLFSQHYCAGRTMRFPGQPEAGIEHPDASCRGGTD